MIGQGKYDAESLALASDLDADGVVLIVFNGNKGDGISMQCSADAVLIMPEILEDMARQMRADLASGRPLFEAKS